MKKKEIIDFITSLSLFILSCGVLVAPIMNFNNIKLILQIILSFYVIFKLTGFILTIKDKDYENLFTSLISLGTIIATFYFKLSPKNLALILLIWTSLISLVKLKKADFYHDHSNKMWILRIFILFAFLSLGLLTSLNLMHDSDIQILLLGFFFSINSMLDAIDPLASYISWSNK